LLSKLREKLASSKLYRESFAGAVVKRMIPLQARVLRRQRDWSQAQLAKESGLTQGVISRAEDPNYGNLTVNTLVRIAAGFDCAFVGRFVPFSELGKWYAALENEKELEVSSFNDDSGFADRAESQVRAATLLRPSIQHQQIASWAANMQAGNTMVHNWAKDLSTGMSLQELALAQVVGSTSAIQRKPVGTATTQIGTSIGVAVVNEARMISS
jgi:transcriptional regulator with XRE-family HTH domain